MLVANTVFRRLLVCGVVVTALSHILTLCVCCRVTRFPTGAPGVLLRVHHLPAELHPQRRPGDRNVFATAGHRLRPGVTVRQHALGALGCVFVLGYATSSGGGWRDLV